MINLASPQVDLVEIGSADPRYQYVESLMLQAFPEDERRDPADQRQAVDSDPRMHCFVIESNARPVGLLTYWTLDGLLYIEHFAIDKALRGQRFGIAALARFLSDIAHFDKDTSLAQTPVVLEVEYPADDITCRRVAFYQRAHLTLWPDTGYIQPPYRKGGDSVPLRLMATPDLDPAAYTTVRDQLYTHVYKVPMDGELQAPITKTS